MLKVETVKNSNGKESENYKSTTSSLLPGNVKGA